MAEPLKGGEFEAVSQRFRDFIVGHTSEATDGLQGSLRNGRYQLEGLVKPLIPLDEVVFGKFNDGEPDDEPDREGFSVELLDGDVSRYGLQLRYGTFNEYHTELGIDYERDIDPSTVSGLIDALEMLETEGHLVPSTTEA